MTRTPERPRRVLHVIEAMHQGGAESLIVEHLRHSGAGFEPMVCALNRGGPALEAALALGSQTYLLEKGREHPFLGRLGAVRRLAQLMREERIDVVNGHNPVGALYAGAAARLARVPLLVRTEHSLHYSGRHSPVYPWIERALTRAARRVICVCEAVRQSHLGRLTWARDRFVTIANGISPPPPTRGRLATRSELGLAPADRIVLSVGSLTPQKAQHVLIDAFAEVVRRVPEAVLVLVGDGPLRGALEARARERQLGSRMIFLGSRNDTPDLMEATDVYALSSVREGLSITLLEAMRAGRAAVATRAGGNPEALVHGETGLLVPMNDVNALAASLHELLADPVRLETMGRAARAHWGRSFTAERMVRETEELYDRELAALGRAWPGRLVTAEKIPAQATRGSGIGTP